MCRSITGPVNSPAAQAVQMLASYQPVSVDHWAGEFAGWCHRYDQNIGYLECRSITGPVNSPARCRFRSRCSHKCRSITGPVNSPARAGREVHGRVEVSVDHWAGEFAGRPHCNHLPQWMLWRALRAWHHRQPRIVNVGRWLKLQAPLGIDVKAMRAQPAPCRVTFTLAGCFPAHFAPAANTPAKLPMSNRPLNRRPSD